MPYLADTKIAVEFKNILINTDYQLISGVVETSFNPDWKNVTDVEDFTGEGQGGQIEETVPFIIKDIVINANGDIVVNGIDGQQVTIPGGKDTVITDSGGRDASGNEIPSKVYTVDSAGNGSNQGVVVAEGGKPTPENTDGVDENGQATAFTAKGISIVFSNNEDTNNGAKSKYAFDVMPNNTSPALQKLYKKVGDVALPYKAVLNGDTDTVLATVTLTDANIKLDSIVFKTQNGAKINFTRNDKTFVLTVKGNLSYAEEQIVATIKQGDKLKVIGAFMLVHISPKNVNVALVPTDAVSQKKLDGIITDTQAIYNKVGVKINFKKEEVLNIDSVSGDTIQTDKSTLTSTYSTEQQNINALYKGTTDSYVLFITDKKAFKGESGYMRLNGQFGYVFAPPSGAGGETPAHELGHGIFKLEHPFEQYNTSESSTDLLMDYSSGTVLNHQDWKQINDPAFKLYAFQSQASGEIAGGFAIAPDWNFVSNGEETKVDNLEAATEGFLGGFVDNNGVTYKWDGKKYINQEGVPNTKAIVKEPAIGSKIYLFYNNNNSCGNNNFLRTTYTIELQEIVKAKDLEKLVKYIARFSGDETLKRKEKDENRTTYWAVVACNKNSNNIDYKNYVVNLGKNANQRYTEDKIKVDTQEAHLFDLATVISDKEKQKILDQLVEINKSTGTLCKIYLVDSKTPKDKITEINNYLSSLKGKEIGLLIDFTKTTDPSIKTFLGDGIEGKGTSQMDKYLKALIEVLPKFDGTYTPFNPLTAMLDGSAGVIGKAKIPARFYNPDEKNYNPIPGQVYSLITFSIVKDKLNNFVLNNDPYVEKFSESRCGFAFTCGIWNGLVGAVGGIPEGASMVIKLITNEDDQAVKLWDGLSKMSWSTIGDMAGEQWNKYSANPCMASYATGEVGFIVISCFYGAGEAKGISAFLQTLDKLDVVGQAIGKFAKITSPFIKAGVNKFGKFVITPLAKLEPGISQKLREALKANFKKLLKKSDQLSLSLHATDQGKFLVDGVELTPEELGELLSKKLSNKKEIVLLSCNDLTSARALSEATGKVVYTTDGAITVFEDGIRRAEGTEWYRIEPNGTTTKVDPPVNECTNCTGDGVDMGKRKEFILNTPEDLYKKIEYYRATVRDVLDTKEARAYALKYFNKNVKDQTFEEWWAYAKKYSVADDLNFEIHHVIPIKVLEKNPKLKELLFWAENNGKKFEFNGLDNAIPLQKKKANIGLNGHTNHPKYDDAITQKINGIVNNPILDEVEKFEEIQKLINKTKKNLEENVLLGKKDVNDIIDL